MAPDASASGRAIEKNSSGNVRIVSYRLGKGDLAIFPGGGRPPSVQTFRLSTPGFKELAGISHFGPAVCTENSIRVCRMTESARLAR
jgi:hypothetical protein